MPRVIALDLEETAVKAALAEVSFRGVRIEALLSEPVAGQGNAFDALARLMRTQVGRFDSAVCTAPQGSFSYRLLELPFADRRKLESVVPFELEGHLPFDLEGHTVSFAPLGSRRGDSHLVLATIASKDWLGSYLHSLASVGIDPVAVDLPPAAAANLLLHITRPGEGAEGLIDVSGYRILVALAVEGRLAGIRAWRLAGQGAAETAARALWNLSVLANAVAVEASSIWIAGGASNEELLRTLRRATAARVRSVNDASLAAVPPGLRDRQAEFVVPIGLALGQQPRLGTSIALNLRQAELAYHGKREELWRRVGRLGALAFLSILLLVAGWAVRRGREQEKIAELGSRIRSVFRQTLPEVTRVVNEKAQLEAAYADLARKRELFGNLLPSATKTIDLLRALTEAIPPDVGLDVEELTLEGGALRLSGSVPSFEAVDSLKRSLSSIPRFAATTIADVKASVDNKRVSFRATMTLEGN